MPLVFDPFCSHLMQRLDSCHVCVDIATVSVTLVVYNALNIFQRRPSDSGSSRGKAEQLLTPDVSIVRPQVLRSSSAWRQKKMLLPKNCTL